MIDEKALRRLTPIASQVTSGLIADQIRELIADGTFPQGAQITEQSLTAALGVSRGPIREAFQRLIQENLLRNERNRGIFVVELTSADIIDIYNTRAAIEIAAMEAVIARQDGSFVAEAEEILHEMERLRARGDRAGVSELDLQFHLLLIKSSRSPRLERAFGTLMVETRMCLKALEHVTLAQKDNVEIHQDMLKAVRAQDMDMARRAVRAHNQTVLRDFGLVPAA